ncbi:putative alcohol O-acetyltransferase [Helianthus debilis subsp. tardiflorus]
MGIKVKVIKTEVVAPKQPWSEHWLPLTNLDLVVPPIDMGCFFCYKKPHDKVDMVDALKTSLSQVLIFFYPIAGEIVPTATGELEIHCNYRGVDFTEAAADVELWELDFYNHNDNIGVKLMPQEHRGVLAIQVNYSNSCVNLIKEILINIRKIHRIITKFQLFLKLELVTYNPLQVTMLKCGGMVIACLFDHRVIDGYSMNMFTTSWANMTRSQPPSLVPYFDRSDLKPRHSKHYTPYVANMFFPLSKLPSPESDSDNELDLNQDSRISRIYYIKGEQINELRLLASENGIIRSKVESFASFLWKITASFLEDSGYPGYMCNIAVPVDGRRWLSEGEGVEKEKRMAERCGNVFSIPFRGIRAQVNKDFKCVYKLSCQVFKILFKSNRRQNFKRNSSLKKKKKTK